MTRLKPYSDLAGRIVAGRSNANLKQADLADQLGIKQQSVSRWEAGTHRPSVEQIPALARAIDANPNDLMVLAGYGQPPIIAPLPPFPLEALSPAALEQFVADLLEAKYPEAKVSVQGGSGHTQDGTDVVATFPDGTTWSVQCKRVERFGPADVDKVVRHHSFKADRRFLALSRVASPQAAQAVAAHDGWTLWDKHDINRLVRTLPAETQDRLVDIYFSGQRLALLGRNEPGPWITADQYFAPFRGRDAVFSHDWAMVGREAEIARLTEGLADEVETPVVLLTGPGGMGKTRIIKEGVAAFQVKNKTTLVRFLSAARDVSRASLETLGHDRKVLVIDDAHDREGLGVLIEYAADPANKTRLLIATRPYAEQRIRNELAIFNIVDPMTIALQRQSKAELKQLITQVLDAFGGDDHLANAISEIAQDSPLIAAMAARVVARDGIPPELARREKNLRQIMLSRFTKVITGNLGAATDAPVLHAVMEVLAVIQPFHVDDRSVADLIAKTRPTVTVTDVTRALKILIDGGVIFKRGHLYRLMPDLLGDFLIEESCVGADGALTPFALQIAEEVGHQKLEQVLVNLGRMDWRLSEGDPSASKLLDPIWTALRGIDSEYDGRLQAIEAVAYYQPGQALDFVEAMIAKNQIYRQFGTILRRIALSAEHRTAALRLLWDLGRDNARDLGPNPDHPIRILADLIGYEEHKSFAFNEDLSRFAFGLLEEPDAWNSIYSPLDLLEPLLSGQGMTTHSTGRGFSLTPFFVDHAVVASLRERVIDSAITLLSSDHPRTARRAALFLNSAIRAPYGMLNTVAPEELDQAYHREFSGTIAKISRLVDQGELEPWTLIGLIRSLSWHAQFDEGALGDAVRDIFAAMPGSIDFRLYGALSDGAEWNFAGQIAYEDWEEDKDWQEAFAEELIRQFEPASLLEAISERLQKLDAAGEATGQSGQLIDKLITADPRVGDALIDIVRSNPSHRLRFFIGIAVGAKLENEPEEGRRLVALLLDDPDDNLRQGAARALIGLKRPYGDADHALLERALQSEDAHVASIAITAVRTWRNLLPRAIINFALMVRFDQEPLLLDHVAGLLCSQRKTLLTRLQDNDVTLLLSRMQRLPRIDGHYVEEILQHLAEHHAAALAEFLFARADWSLTREEREDDFSVLGFAARRDHLGFEKSPALATILAAAWSWLRAHDDDSGWAHYRRASLIAKMFRPDDDRIVAFFGAVLARADAVDLRWIARIVRHGHHRFPFKHQAFVLRYFDRCKQIDQEAVTFGLDQFSAGALSGGWSGSVGEPMPRDLSARDNANTILAKMSRLSPAFPLYKEILAHAERNIQRSIQEGEALDAEQ